MFAHRSGILAVATLAVLGATTLFAPSALRAQEERSDRPGMRGPSPEMVMSLRDRLQLTEGQLEALEELRTERVAERSARRAEMEEMRSRFRAGQIDRAELRAFMEGHRPDASEIEERRARLESVLDEDQLRTLNDMRVRRAEMRGRRGAMRGGRPGMRRDRSGMRPDRPGMRRGGRPGMRRPDRSGLRGSDRDGSPRGPVSGSPSATS